MTTIQTPGVIITLADETEDTRDLDLRTREGREDEVRRQVRDFGGFSVFWVTENERRAQAADRLIMRREIIRNEPDTGFPWCSYRLRESRP